MHGRSADPAPPDDRSYKTGQPVHLEPRHGRPETADICQICGQSRPRPETVPVCGAPLRQARMKVRPRGRRTRAPGWRDVDPAPPARKDVPAGIAHGHPNRLGLPSSGLSAVRNLADPPFAVDACVNPDTAPRTLDAATRPLHPPAFSARQRVHLASRCTRSCACTRRQFPNRTRFCMIY